MRTVFIHEDSGVCARVSESLAGQAAALARSRASALRRSASDSVDDWALIGPLESVRARVAEYREKLGMTHMIARTGVPGAEPRDVEASLHALAELSPSRTATDTV